MNIQMTNRERGVALVFSIFALLLLTAIGAALIFMATTETEVNSNYRQEQIAYFGAKAGVEEARARMMASDQYTINIAANPLLYNPASISLPGTGGNPMIVYITNSGTGTAVQPWVAGNAYADDEICHDGYGTAFGVPAPPDVRCTQANGGVVSLPGGSYLSYTSTLPFNGTSGALPYKWVRIAPKINSSSAYLSSTPGSTAATVTYNAVNSGYAGTNLICWDGQEEVPLTGAANCPAMTSTAPGYGGAAMTNVYLVTALGISPEGARKMIQAEVALMPESLFPYGLFGTSTACPAVNFSGQHPTTNSYSTANGGTYATTATDSGGDIGSNGGINIGNGNVYGVVGYVPGPSCPTPLQQGPNGTDLGTNDCPSGNMLNCQVSFPTPPAPNPMPPNTSYTPPDCSGKKNTGQCMVPGTYGNIDVTGTLYLAPGTYNINSLSMTGNAAIIVNPPGAVTLNMGGTGQSTVLAIGGNGITDDQYSNDFIINYYGTDGISIAGNGDVTAILNAPNAPIIQQGNGNWYGAILGSTIQIGGNAFFHYDRNIALAPINNNYFSMISYREIPY